MNDRAKHCLPFVVIDVLHRMEYAEGQVQCCGVKLKPGHRAIARAPAEFPTCRQERRAPCSRGMRRLYHLDMSIGHAIGDSSSDLAHQARRSPSEDCEEILKKMAISRPISGRQLPDARSAELLQYLAVCELRGHYPHSVKPSLYRAPQRDNDGACWVRLSISQILGNTIVMVNTTAPLDTYDRRQSGAKIFTAW